ncbi:hypothetical protein BO70DRAFT_109493 [Aspergillus heteromorphus CBS 117.55]|uniref:Uncharacterized protein n=1 Tax=Aspergillus heteromorphus CBS 117.55 TaxID=1448321 RepID=A0A317VGZ0_9EURO|nr:uncharacterized protein BO70DRAFT_109493 [Aspergillus heteromorphus CBS 117.55]PWY73636.1 hypothetical protein BO70DRAFT_109493 [Aspergillus heteromorphus CBS 117.55]
MRRLHSRSVCGLAFCIWARGVRLAGVLRCVRCVALRGLGGGLRICRIRIRIRIDLICSLIHITTLFSIFFVYVLLVYVDHIRLGLTLDCCSTCSTCLLIMVCNDLGYGTVYSVQCTLYLHCVTVYYLVYGPRS